MTMKPTFVQSLPRAKALVMFSGGLDSLVSLLWAISKYGIDNVMALGFDYNQTHKKELKNARALADDIGVFFEVIKVQALAELSEGGLVNSAANVWDDSASDMNPTLFVPGRNLVFASFAAAVAVTHGATVIVNGEGQADSTPFPDAEQKFFTAMEAALTAGMGVRMKIATPLMGKTKGGGLKLGIKLIGKERFLQLAKHSISCYRATECGDCPACELRRLGWEEVGLPDPRLVKHKVLASP